MNRISKLLKMIPRTRDLDTALRQSVFGIETHALRVEHGQEVVGAKLESLRRSSLVVEPVYLHSATKQIKQE